MDKDCASAADFAAAIFPRKAALPPPVSATPRPRAPRHATMMSPAFATLCRFAVLWTALGAFPAPRWWEMGGTTSRSFSPECGLGEGSSARGQMVGLPAFMDMLEELHAQNISTLQLDTVYDSGPPGAYVLENLWCGLAISNASAPLQNIGSEADWHTIVDQAHAYNMMVTSFANWAYFWTGSPYFKQAERDIQAHGLAYLPALSPADHRARWQRDPRRVRRHVGQRPGHQRRRRQDAGNSHRTRRIRDRLPVSAGSLAWVQ